MTPWTALLCHRRPDRALRIGSWTAPLCARCAAFYPALGAGFAMGFLLDLLALLGPGGALLLYGAAVLPLAVDGLTQALGRRESSAFLRLGTGSLAGAVAGLLLPVLLLG